tara:strand:+ start:1216 stop:1377 length:162 start_codon:yes stop_codon:yes gene_type:complete
MQPALRSDQRDVRQITNPASGENEDLTGMAGFLASSGSEYVVAQTLMSIVKTG